MNCNPTLTAKEFKTIHNALCDIRSIASSIDGVVREAITDKLDRAIREFESGLRGAYDQDHTAFDRKCALFQDIQEGSKFTSIWSIYEVENFADTPFPDAETVLYQGVEEKLYATDWHALWEAADRVICKSGDEHHIYIEAFSPNPKKPTQLLLSTGS